MNIEREETGTLTATLKVKLLPEDYSPGVEKALKEQRKNAVLPGFRPGQVPMTIIKKRVGRTLLVTEVERLIDENLKQFIHELDAPVPRQLLEYGAAVGVQDRAEAANIATTAWQIFSSLT